MKIIFIDFDGTLYDYDKMVIPESALIAIEKTKAKGNKVFITTGRALSESQKVLNYNYDGFVFSAGAVIYAEGKQIYKKAYTLDEVNNIISILKKYDKSYIAEGDAGSYCDPKCIKHLSRKHNIYDHSEIIKKLRTDGLYELEYWDKRDDITKICSFGESREEYDELYEPLKKYNLNFSAQDEENKHFCFEITQPGHNKSTAAKMVLDYYGLTFDDAIGIGDSDNDYELLRDCKIGIAMGNAHPKELEIADYITDTVDNDGLYKAFKKFDLIK